MPARSVVAADKPTLPRWQEAGLFMAVVPSRWPPSSTTIDGAGGDHDGGSPSAANRSEDHTSELKSLMRRSYAVFCLKKTKNTKHTKSPEIHRSNAKNRQTTPTIRRLPPHNQQHQK